MFRWFVWDSLARTYHRTLIGTLFEIYYYLCLQNLVRNVYNKNDNWTFVKRKKKKQNWKKYPQRDKKFTSVQKTRCFSLISSRLAFEEQCQKKLGLRCVSSRWIIDLISVIVTRVRICLDRKFGQKSRFTLVRAPFQWTNARRILVLEIPISWSSVFLLFLSLSLSPMRESTV